MAFSSTPQPDAHVRAAIWMFRRVRADGRGRQVSA